MTENIKDISFVIIARNEEFALQKCLDSLEKLELSESEIILVDSDSNDNTINLMKNFAERNPSNTIVLKCSGYLNASVGRNAGLDYATKEYVFFVDGDTEINAGFIYEAVRIFKNRTDVIAITGKLSEVYYSSDYSAILRRVSDRFSINCEKKAYSSGGNIIIRHKNIKQIGGWDANLPVNEDFSLSAQILNYGHLIAIPFIMGIHHTKEYKERTLQNFFKGYPAYWGYIIKNNITKIYFLYHLFKGNSGYTIGLLIYSLVILSISLVLLKSTFVNISLILCFLLIFTDFMIGVFAKKSIIERVIIRFLYPSLIFYGFFMKKMNHQHTTKIMRIL